jgi:hypothetical protein
MFCYVDNKMCKRRLKSCPLPGLFKTVSPVEKFTIIPAKRPSWEQTRHVPSGQLYKNPQSGNERRNQQA